MLPSGVSPERRKPQVTRYHGTKEPHGPHPQTGLSLVLTLALVVAQAVAGVVAHSTGLLADAGHNLTDVGALALSLVAVRLALRPASPARSFGNHRATILAALANAVLIAAVTVLIVVSAVHRLLHPGHVEAGIVVVVAAVGLVVNGLAAWLLAEDGRDLNMRGRPAPHARRRPRLGRRPGGRPGAAGRPVGHLARSGVVPGRGRRHRRPGRRRVPLGRRRPARVDPARCRPRPPDGGHGRRPGVTGVHDLHVWSLSSEVRVLSAHLVLTGHPTLEEANVVGDRVKHAIGGPFGIAHSTLELECEPCADVDADPCAMDAADGAGPHRHHH